MEFAKNEASAVEVAIDNAKSDVLTQLVELELCYVGGGIGDVVGH